MLPRGQRTACRTKLRLKDHINRNLSGCHITPYDLEDAAGDRDVWSSVCNTRLTAYSQESVQAVEERTSRRHVTATTAPGDPRVHSVTEYVPLSSACAVISAVMYRSSEGPIIRGSGLGVRVTPNLTLGLTDPRIVDL